MNIEADRLKVNDAVVSALQTALYYGGNSLRHVPSLVKRVIRERCWEEREVSATHRIAQFAAFTDFVTRESPDGLGTDHETLKRLCADDREAIDLIDRMEQRPASLHALDNIQGTEAPTGTSAQAALRRLRKDRPDLHARVIAGELSPHAAAVEAGFRKKTVTLPLDPAAWARAACKHFDTKQRAVLVEALSDNL